MPFLLAFLLLNGSTAFSQGTTTTENGVTTRTLQGISLSAALRQLTDVAAGREIGDTLRVVTAIEVAGRPLGTSAGGFAFKLDKTTGLEVRTASTFGPAFAERAITAGAGQMSFAASVTTATYDKLDKTPLDRIQISSTASASPLFSQNGLMSLVLTAQTTVIQGVMGAADNFDVGVAVPIVRVKLDGLAWIENSNFQRRANDQDEPDILTRGSGGGVSSGLGDIAVLGKFRFLRFGKPPAPDQPLEPDPGGLALVGTVRLPTGSRENLRGLGVTRALGSLVFSAGKGRFRPHANVGYEWWDKGLDVVRPGSLALGLEPVIVTARHSFQYAAGVELEATPKLTFIVDFLSRQINGGGKIGFQTLPNPLREFPQVASLTIPLPLPEGFLKQSIVPGLKWNLKGKILLSLNGIISVRDNGLYDKFTPVAGLDLTF